MEERGQAAIKFFYCVWSLEKIGINGWWGPEIVEWVPSRGQREAGIIYIMGKKCPYGLSHRSLCIFSKVKSRVYSTENLVRLIPCYTEKLMVHRKVEGTVHKPKGINNSYYPLLFIRLCLGHMRPMGGPGP